jgi:hypothetical protein
MTFSNKRRVPTISPYLRLGKTLMLSRRMKPARTGWNFGRRYGPC